MVSLPHDPNPSLTYPSHSWTLLPPHPWLHPIYPAKRALSAGVPDWSPWSLACLSTPSGSPGSGYGANKLKCPGIRAGAGSGSDSDAGSGSWKLLLPLGLLGNRVQLPYHPSSAACLGMLGPAAHATAWAIPWGRQGLAHGGPDKILWWAAAQGHILLTSALDISCS